MENPSTTVVVADAPVGKIYASIVCRRDGVEYGIFGEAGEAAVAAFKVLDAEFAGAPGYTAGATREPAVDDGEDHVAQKIAALTGSSAPTPAKRPYWLGRRGR
jgi:hypothetical protein